MILSVKLKNELKKICDGMSLEFKLKNISVNGQKRGCSGFIKNNENGKILYINTESSCYSPLSKKTMFRYANDFNDFSGKGGYNQWANNENLFLELKKALM